MFSIRDIVGVGFVLLAGCSSGGAQPDLGPSGPHDASMQPPNPMQDLAPQPDLSSSGSEDLRGAGDLAMSMDMTSAADMSMPADLTAAADLTMPPDLAFPTEQGVDIYVDNTCKMDVIPKVFNVPRGTSLKLTYYNRSRYYAVDVWMSYGGGYTDLMTGMNWPERFEHCRYPRPYSEYADISTACSKYRLMINCL